MSITRERAAEWFETHMPTGKVKPVQKQAYLEALTALRPVSREQVERMRGEWRPIHGLSEYYCSRCGEEFEIHAYDKDKYQFCPCCMAPMTDEAVEMVMRRLEVIG